MEKQHKFTTGTIQEGLEVMGGCCGPMSDEDRWEALSLVLMGIVDSQGIDRHRSPSSIFPITLSSLGIMLLGGCLGAAAFHLVKAFVF